LLIRRIRELLYGQGFTISGARNQLEDSGQPESRADVSATSLNILALRREIKAIINLLSA